MDSKVEFLFLNEEDMIKAGVLDADRAVDTIGEVITLLSEGDYLMGGRAHNDHGVQLIFPEKSDIPNFPLADSSAKVCRHRHESSVCRIRKREVRNIRLIREYELYTVIVIRYAAHEIVPLT